MHFKISSIYEHARKWKKFWAWVVHALSLIVLLVLIYIGHSTLFKAHFKDYPLILHMLSHTLSSLRNIRDGKWLKGVLSGLRSHTELHLNSSDQILAWAVCVWDATIKTVKTVGIIIPPGLYYYLSGAWYCNSRTGKRRTQLHTRHKIYF